MGLIKAIGALLFIGGLLLWAAWVLPSVPAPLAVEVPEEGIASPLPALEEEGRTVIEGVAIYDASITPVVPYIQYRWREGEVRTKQLIFRDERGCSPTAGDLPCVIDPSAPSPQVAYGEDIRVTGVIIGDQILVERIEYL